MTFDMPGTVSESGQLREIAEGAPKTTAATVRQALIDAAMALERHEQRAGDAARIIEEALALRVSEMDSQSRSTDIDRKVKAAMRAAVERLRRG